MPDRFPGSARAFLVLAVCSLLLVPVILAMVLGGSPGSRAASPPRRPDPPDPTVPTTTTTPPPTTAAPPAPAPAEVPPEPPPPPVTPPPAPRPAPAPATVAPAPPEPPPPAAASCSGGGDVAALHNAIRCANGLGALASDGGVDANAQAAANRLLGGGSCDTMTHTDVGSVYAGLSAGENLGCVYSSAGCSGSFAGLMGSWMASPGHRANILDPSYTRIGAASACDGHNQYFVVQFTS